MPVAEPGRPTAARPASPAAPQPVPIRVARPSRSRPRWQFAAGMARGAAAGLVLLWVIAILAAGPSAITSPLAGLEQALGLLPRLSAPRQPGVGLRDADGGRPSGGVAGVAALGNRRPGRLAPGLLRTATPATPTACTGQTD